MEHPSKRMGFNCIIMFFGNSCKSLPAYAARKLTNLCGGRGRGRPHMTGRPERGPKKSTLKSDKHRFCAWKREESGVYCNR